jgi:hypothetical protein
MTDLSNKVKNLTITQKKFFTILCSKEYNIEILDKSRDDVESYKSLQNIVFQNVALRFFKYASKYVVWKKSKDTQKNANIIEDTLQYFLNLIISNGLVTKTINLFIEYQDFFYINIKNYQNSIKNNTSIIDEIIKMMVAPVQHFNFDGLDSIKIVNIKDDEMIYSTCQLYIRDKSRNLDTFATQVNVLLTLGAEPNTMTMTFLGNEPIIDGNAVKILTMEFVRDLNLYKCITFPYVYIRVSDHTTYSYVKNRFRIMTTSQDVKENIVAKNFTSTNNLKLIDSNNYSNTNVHGKENLQWLRGLVYDGKIDHIKNFC